MRRWDLLRAVLLALFLLHSSALVAAQRRGGSLWQTLNGTQPLVIARGGFSGLFPDSSFAAYAVAVQTSFQDVVLWCDVQLTKDGVGICLPNVDMGNCTDISRTFMPTNTTINGKRVSGWFPVDYTFQQLSNSTALIQGIYSRTDKYDSNFPILPVKDLSSVNPAAVWLNIQNDLFYQQHNMSMRGFLLKLTKTFAVDYISSPEVFFLRNISATFKGNKPKFIFRFLGEDVTEPSTNQTYGSLLKNLTFIQTFASGILIPKSYIWPVNADLYLQQPTSIVSDAHKIGLEVFASDFANDAVFVYNYSYNPINEYLQFVDNGNFSVDGVLSDYPVTASEAIGCFSHINNSNTVTGNPLVISHNGASGMFPGCTDLAYTRAVKDGADFIDCPVQVTKDGILICQVSINLMDGTTVSTSPFGTRLSIIPEIQSAPGIYTFNFTWEEIQTLKPSISNPFITPYNLFRNPANKNAGTFMTLADFLSFAKDKPTGVLIDIENAAFLAENLGFDVTTSVIKALDDSGYNQTISKVKIQSSNSSVLIAFKQKTEYDLVYKVDELYSDADPSSVRDIKKFASSVAVKKSSIFPSSQAFLTSQTNLVKTLKSANFSVYVYVLMNEFVSQPWDFFSDPIVGIYNYVRGVNVDGIVTDDPQTASAYRRNTCLSGGRNFNFSLVQPGALQQIMFPAALPPSLPPLPSLTASDVVEPPLPPPKQSNISNPPSGKSNPPSTPPNLQPQTLPSLFLSLAMLLAFLLLI